MNNDLDKTHAIKSEANVGVPVVFIRLLSFEYPL